MLDDFGCAVVVASSVLAYLYGWTYHLVLSLLGDSL